ncbi:MAG: hypothetical protein WCJ64_07750 [Rhodospirillaceae bacterium]
MKGVYGHGLLCIRYDAEGKPELANGRGGWITPDKGVTLFGPSNPWVPRPEYGRPKRLLQMGDRWVKSKSCGAHFWAMAALPYGVWVLEDGSEVIFNRGYSPIWRKDAAGQVVPVEHHWVPWKRQQWFCKGGGFLYPKIRAELADILRRWLTEPEFRGAPLAVYGG